MNDATEVETKNETRVVLRALILKNIFQKFIYSTNYSENLKRQYHVHVKQWLSNILSNFVHNVW